MVSSLRCAATVYPLPAEMHIAGVPLCGVHRNAIRKALAGPDADSERAPVPGRVWSRAAKSYTNPPPEDDQPKTAKKKPKPVRITTRVRLSPQQSAVSPEEAELLGCVYYITTRKNAEFVKIGTTRQVSARFKQILGASGERPRLLVAEPGSVREERARHLQFDHIRVGGTEFFHYTDELVDHIAQLRQRYPHYRDFTDAGRSYD